MKPSHFLTLYLCLLLDPTYCCNSQLKKKNPTVIHRIFPGAYSEGTFQDKPECMNLRYTPDIKRTSDVKKSEPCNNMVPGLTVLENGCIPNFFDENLNEYNSRRYQKVLHLTCDGKSGENFLEKRYVNYTVPEEVLSMISISLVQFDQRRFSNTTILNAFEKDVGLVMSENNNICHLPLLQSDLKSIGSAEYFEVLKLDFEVTLRADTKPSQHIINEYNNLQENWRNDADGYYRFITQFGTHMRHSTKFGGSLRLLNSQTSTNGNFTPHGLGDIVSITGFVTQFGKVKRSEESTIGLIVLGGSPSSINITDWINSTAQQPVPLNSKYFPLNEFLDDEYSIKSQSLRQFISFETDHQMYKKYSYQLKMLDEKNKLSQFIRSRLTDQLKYVCSSNYLNEIIHNGIEKGSNIKLDKFFVEFVTNETFLTNSTEVDFVYINRIHLIPSVCFTFLDPVNSITDPFMRLPSDVKCLKLFTKENCNGNNLIIFELSDIQAIFSKNVILSLMMCS